MEQLFTNVLQLDIIILCTQKYVKVHHDVSTKQSINIWVIATININYIKRFGSHHMFVNTIVFHTYICLNVFHDIEISSVSITYSASSNCIEGRPF